eukprot:TRINITY_DN13147_c0_g1_i1.p1 TRINITY_DN13147_c0_g1~~TRINITY_DN13147_c0_g1_i1.p1  ORF type:complete len:608 (+),score=207.18 TRINITY_DN13147_c0_g1_i1:67-1824(+)
MFRSRLVSSVGLRPLNRLLSLPRRWLADGEGTPTPQSFSSPPTSAVTKTPGSETPLEETEKNGVPVVAETKADTTRVFELPPVRPITLYRLEDLKTDFRELIQFHANPGSTVTITNTVHPHDIFAKDEVDLSKVNVWGFDFDFVLVAYTSALQPLIYNLARHYMVNAYGYPPKLANVKYDPDFAIRGLHFDVRKGWLMKVDFVSNVDPHSVYFGRNQVPPEEVVDAYLGVHIDENYFAKNIRQFSDLFELAELTLLADTIQLFNDSSIKFDPSVIYRDITQAISTVHKYGVLHDTIINDLGTYILPNPNLPILLERLKENQKHLFILTNNTFRNVDVIMSYLMSSNDKPKDSWKDYFDVVMTKADKPSFFVQEDRPFRQVDKSTGRMHWGHVRSLEPGQIYTEGCLNHLLMMKDWESRGILYMGDHIRNDLIEPGKVGWHTCAIIKELEHSIQVQISPNYVKLMYTLERLQALRQRVVPIQKDNEARKMMTEIDAAICEILHDLKLLKHKNFGCSFVSRRKESFLAFQLLHYADMYTSSITNFLNIPFDALMTPRRRLLPHEQRVYLPELVASPVTSYQPMPGID